MLQRIFDTSFPKEADLLEHLRLLEVAKKRDHRKLGKELELFMFTEEAPGQQGCEGNDGREADRSHA